MFGFKRRPLEIIVTVHDDFVARELCPDIEQAGLYEPVILENLNTILGKVATRAIMGRVSEVPGVIAAEASMPLRGASGL